MERLKKISGIILFLFFSFNVFGQTATGDGIRKITDRLYKITLNKNFPVNVVAFYGPDGILLVDDGRQNDSDELKAKLNELPKGEVKVIINTHFHGDHMGGNRLFADKAEIIGHKLIKKELSTGLNILQDYPANALPGKELNGDDQLEFNGEQIKIYSLPGSHTDTDIVVYFTKSNVVCLGGIIYSGKFPYIGINDGGSYKNYHGVIEKIIDLFPDDAIFITGHGRNLTKGDIKEYAYMLDQTGKIVQKAMVEGQTVAEMQKAHLLKNWRIWGTGFVTTDRWIQYIANSINPPQKDNRESIAIPLFQTLKSKNVKATIAQYNDLKANKADRYDFGEANLNLLGYTLLAKNKYPDAIAIFKLNVKQFPKSANVYDSLGEAYERTGQKGDALKYYTLAVQKAKLINDPNITVYENNLKRMQQ